MKRSRFTDQQIAFALQQAEQGTQVGEVTRKMGVSEPTLYRWKKKYGGLMPSEVRKLRQLEEENVGCVMVSGGSTPSCSGRAGRSTTNGSIGSIAPKDCRCTTSRPGAG